MFFISKRHDDFHVNFLKYMCACGQVFAGFNVEVVRGQLDELITKTSKHEDALPPSAGTTTRTGQSGGDQARPGVPVFDTTLLSGMVKSSVISSNNGRNLKEADCSVDTTPILVSSTRFPLLEGCLAPTVVDDVLLYTSGTAGIAYVESSDTSTVRIR